MSEKTSLVERKVDTKLILMSAWIVLMVLYLYCDWFWLFRPGQISEMMNGKMGPFDVTQICLFSAGLLMVIPSLMILISALATAKIGRIVNLTASVIYFLVNIGNLLGETWAYYYLFGLLELGLVIFIFIMALRWPRQSS
jgi:cbb3-type cytochrome oxidase subunit 3